MYWSTMLQVAIPAIGTILTLTCEGGVTACPQASAVARLESGLCQIEIMLTNVEAAVCTTDV